MTAERALEDEASDTWAEFDTHPVALALFTWHEGGNAMIALAVDDVQAAVTVGWALRCGLTRANRGCARRNRWNL